MYTIGRFRVANASEALITVIGSLVLVHGAALAFSIAARLRLSRTLRFFEAVWAKTVIRALNIEAEIVGADHLPGGPAILLPLHEGFVDAPLLMNLKRSTRFVARDELFEWPQFGQVLRSCGHPVIPTEPTRGDLRRFYHEAISVLEQGSNLVIFPQGSILGVEVAFAQGARRLAAHLGVPVIPIVITGTHRVWEHPYSPTLRRGVYVRMEILEPLPSRSSQSSWEEMERRMKTIALSQERAPARRFVPERDGYWDGYDYEIDPSFPELKKQVALHRRIADRSDGPFQSANG